MVWAAVRRGARPRHHGARARQGWEPSRPQLRWPRATLHAAPQLQAALAAPAISSDSKYAERSSKNSHRTDARRRDGGSWRTSGPRRGGFGRVVRRLLGVRFGISPKQGVDAIHPPPYVRYRIDTYW